MRFALLFFGLLQMTRAAGGVTLAEAGATMRTTATGSLSIVVENRASEPKRIAQPAGLICAAEHSELRAITLRALELDVPAHQVAEATVPCAALASTTGAEPQSVHATAETEPRLAPLLAYFARSPDVPRLTAQLLVWCVLEDITFAQWRIARGAKGDPTPPEVVAAIDAAGVLREIAPQRQFALATDGGLKILALRNPVARGKAMQLYGIALPDAPLPPDLSSLLHTKPGDNCPICRQRALMQPREDGL